MKKPELGRPNEDITAAGTSEQANAFLPCSLTNTVEEAVMTLYRIEDPRNISQPEDRNQFLTHDETLYNLMKAVSDIKIIAECINRLPDQEHFFKVCHRVSFVITKILVASGDYDGTRDDIGSHEVRRKWLERLRLEVQSLRIPSRARFPGVFVGRNGSSNRGELRLVVEPPVGLDFPYILDRPVSMDDRSMKRPMRQAEGMYRLNERGCYVLQEMGLTPFAYVKTYVPCVDDDDGTLQYRCKVTTGDLSQGGIALIITREDGVQHRSLLGNVSVGTRSVSYADSGGVPFSASLHPNKPPGL